MSAERKEPAGLTKSEVELFEGRATDKCGTHRCALISNCSCRAWAASRAAGRRK